MAKLEVRNLTISFRTNNGAVRAVRDISFDLNEGETLAIAGESGSGKSVTTRAVMGILAGNAMVEDGTIIYDGKDLLKIPEEEFHTLRGHKLAMVFQDPLSALNPIMRIGNQLTEAMMLNNKERRADGRRRFNETLEHLKKAMIAAKGESARAEIEKNIKTFDSFNITGIKLENDYNAAKEAMTETLDCVEECENAAMRHEVKPIGEIINRLQAAAKHVHNDYIALDAGFDADVAAIVALRGGYNAHKEQELQELLKKIRTALETAMNGEEPNFFCIGYTVYAGKAADPKKTPLAQLNREARQTLDQDFMAAFLADVEKALRYSNEQSVKATRDAVAVLKKEMPVFEKESLVSSECHAAINRASAAVEHAIDPLRLDKDSKAYVFKSSLNDYLKRYFLSLKNNPKEEKRFAADTVKYNRLVKQGKFAASVVPKNLMDTERLHQNMVKTFRELIEHFEQLKERQEIDFAARAVELIDYLKARASDHAYRLTKGMAKHRAIELMKEVGIPEPHKRFHQYPFEFSGGMRQRIVIAIALSANPDILICDEPTTALDVTIQAQILELINRLKKERRLSVIFITHDLGVVANMADRIAIMYAGKIVEYGTADEVFYDPRHPYTWALLASMPDLETKEKLEAIPGTPPNMILPPKGDAFAARNKYAMQIDFEEQPPMFEITPTHTAATWLLHPSAPHVDPPAIVTERINRMKSKEAKGGEQA